MDSTSVVPEDIAPQHKASLRQLAIGLLLIILAVIDLLALFVYHISLLQNAIINAISLTILIVLLNKRTNKKPAQQARFNKVTIALGVFMILVICFLVIQYLLTGRL